MIDKMGNTIVNDKVKSVYSFNDYSIQDLLSKFFEQINSVTDLVNQNEEKINTQNFKLEEFINYMKSEGIPPIVIETVTTMYNDGRLTELFNSLANNVIDKVGEFKTQINSSLEQITQNTNLEIEKVSNSIDKIEKLNSHLFNLNTFLEDISNGVKKFYINQNIYLPNFIELNNINGIELIGIGNNAKIECPDDSCFNLTNCSNIKITNIKFNSTITINLGCEDIYISLCEFKDTNMNGIACNTSNGEIKNIYVDKCKFINSQRMGFEIINHFDTKVVYRFSNINIVNCYFENIGIREYGMGVSLSGYGKDCLVDNNVFVDCRYSCIENVGVSYSKFSNNKFYRRNIEEGETKIFAFTGTRVMKQNLIKNNQYIVENYTPQKSFIYLCEDSVFEDNYLGYIDLRNCERNQFKNNYFFSNKEYLFYIVSCFDNYFYNETYDNNGYTSWYAIQFCGDNKRNTFEKIKIKLGNNNQKIFNELNKYNTLVTQNKNGILINSLNVTDKNKFRITKGCGTNKIKFTIGGSLFRPTSGRNLHMVNFEYLLGVNASKATEYVKGIVGFNVLSNDIEIVTNNLTSLYDSVTITVTPLNQYNCIVIEITTKANNYNNGIGFIEVYGENSFDTEIISEVV